MKHDTISALSAPVFTPASKGAILLPGVRIGRNAVVGAGAVVSRSIPANTVVVGNPARVIREIQQQ